MSKTMPRFVFTLFENFMITMHTGIIGYASDISEKHLRGGELLIGVSLQRTIFGPFRQVGDPFQNDEDLGFVRLDRGDQIGPWYEPGQYSLAIPKICPYRYRVEPIYPEIGVKHGLTWKVAAQVAGIDPRAWGHLRKEEITEDQFEALVKALLLVNTDGNPVPRVTIEELLAKRRKPKVAPSS